MAQDMTLLWGSGSPPCWRIMIMLEEKELKGYNQKLLSFEKKEHKSKEVLDINPRGQFPAFKYKDYILNESYAACLFLEIQYKSQGTKLTPDCPMELALMYQRMFEGFSLLQKTGQVLYYDYNVPENERHESARTRNKEALTTEVKLWEGYLASSSGFLTGKTFSLSDVTVFPNIAYLFRSGLCEKRYPNLAKYYNGLKDRPSIKANWPPHWKESCECQVLLKDI
uniref:Glutathione S-transferase A-like n=1 Tax=Salarias fasciatus TaxID=181472 RepID=A0A672H5X2_SALFA